MKNFFYDDLSEEYDNDGAERKISSMVLTKPFVDGTSMTINFMKPDHQNFMEE